MNIKQQALGGFKRSSDQALLLRGRTILLALDSNSNFTTPDPALPVVKTAVDDYEEKLSIANRRGSPEDTSAKNDARKVLEAVLKKLAFYVTQIADGSLTVLLSSGFEVSTIPQSDNVPGVVTGITLRDGRQEGQMRLDFEKNRSAKMYEYQICKVGADGAPGEWGDSFTTTSSKLNIIAPLEGLQRYGVRVRAINGYGRSDWSEMVTHVVR